jgi:hypothetical protein
MAAEVAIGGVVEAPPPEPLKLAECGVDIPPHQVHEVERLGVVKKLLMAFDPGQGILND